MANFYDFPYGISDDIVIYFGGHPPGDANGDLLIYYPPITDYNWIDCWCSRWDYDNYSIKVETWLKKDALKDLRDNIVPGAVDELYNVLGKPFYYDKTWTASNTVRLRPNPSSNSSLKEMRNEKLIFVKNITSTPIKGNSLWINCKIEGYVSGGSI